MVTTQTCSRHLKWGEGGQSGRIELLTCGIWRCLQVGSVRIELIVWWFWKTHIGIGYLRMNQKAQKMGRPLKGQMHIQDHATVNVWDATATLLYYTLDSFATATNHTYLLCPELSRFRVLGWGIWLTEVTCPYASCQATEKEITTCTSSISITEGLTLPPFYKKKSFLKFFLRDRETVHTLTQGRETQNPK